MCIAPYDKRSVVITTLFVALALASACAGRQSTLPALNLTAKQQQAQEQNQRAQLALRIMDEDVRRIDELTRTFLSHDRALYAPPFPMDLFKQTAMSCLNEPAGVEVPSQLDERQTTFVQTTLDAVELELRCKPRSLYLLIIQLQREVPERIKHTLEQLRRVDELRWLRSKVHQRVAKIPTMIRQQRLELDRQRLELGRVRAQLNRRQDEYNARDYKRSLASLDQLSRQLTALELNLKSLDERHARWEPMAQETLNSFTFELTGLYFDRFDEEPELK